MTDLLFLKIILFSASFGWVYVDKLTENYGLLDFIPQYYPSPIKDLLSCSYCVGGWTSMLITFVFGIDILNLPYILTAPFFTMAVVHLIKKEPNTRR